MRTWMLLGAFLVAALLMSIAVGCGEEKQVGGINTAKLQSAFAGESPAKAEVDKAIASIKAGEYSQALTALGNAAKNEKLTPEQKQAIQDVMSQVKGKVTGVIEQGSQQATDAVQDVQKSLSK